jgi:alpha-beta hydrolase superfamily lysophospholipase
MGAVAILKAIHDYKIEPAGIIIECPFGSLYETVSARFDNLGVPSFPMAGLLTFWGGAQNGFWAFGFKPTTYAKAVACPALVLYGEKDDKVSRNEIDRIYANLTGRKQLKTYPLAAHENYLNSYRNEWVQDVSSFLNQQTNQ